MNPDRVSRCNRRPGERRWPGTKARASQRLFAVPAIAVIIRPVIDQHGELEAVPGFHDQQKSDRQREGQPQRTESPVAQVTGLAVAVGIP